MNVHESYDPSRYDALLTSNDLIGLAESRLDDLLTLGDIICRYDLEAIVGVTLAHRHHDLSPSERIVWQIKEDAKWFASPQQAPASELIAKCWVVSSDGDGAQLRPTEFIPRTALYQPEIAASEIVVAHSEFVREFAQAVADLSLEQAFGLGILHQRPEFNVPGTTIFETSSLKNRTTEAVVIPHTGQSEELGGVTLWHFTKQDGLTGRNRCAHGNSVHCCGN